MQRLPQLIDSHKRVIGVLLLAVVGTAGVVGGLYFIQPSDIPNDFIAPDNQSQKSLSPKAQLHASANVSTRCDALHPRRRPSPGIVYPDDYLVSSSETMLDTVGHSLILASGRRNASNMSHNSFRIGQRTEAIVLLAWVENDKLEYTLHTPERTPARGLDQARHTVNGQYVTYRIEDPPAGKWNFSVKAPAKSGDYRVRVTSATPLDFRVKTTTDHNQTRIAVKPCYKSGSDTIAVENGSVKATVIKPGGTTRTYPLVASPNQTQWSRNLTLETGGQYVASIQAAFDNTTIQRHIAWESELPKSVPPEITAFSLEISQSQGDQKLLISFDSRQELNTVRMPIHRWNVQDQQWAHEGTLNRSDFTRRGDTFVTTAPAESDQAYKVTLQRAVDPAGNDGANNQSRVRGELREPQQQQSNNQQPQSDDENSNNPDPTILLIGGLVLLVILVPIGVLIAVYAIYS